MNSELKKWLLFSTLTIIWGSSFILMKRGLDTFTSTQVICLRAFSAFVALSPLLVKHFNKETLKHWKPILAMGIFGTLLPGFLFVEAQKGITSATSSMINSLVPLFTLILTVLFFNAKTHPINIVGILIGLAGATSLLFINSGGNIGGEALYMGYALLATISNGVTVVVINYYLNKVNSISATVIAMVFVGPISGIYLLNTDFVSRVMSYPEGTASTIYVCILGMLGTALSIIMFNNLIKSASPVFSASVTYLIPAVAILWGILDGEALEPLHFLYVSVILGGVYLVNKKPTISTRKN